MLAKNATEYVSIEPRSDEDLEAAVRDPATALLGLTTQGESFDLVLQAKTRSGAPWTSPAIADVLLGKQTDEESGTGSKRTRPLAMLEGEPRRRYVFVTNEASADALRAHEGQHLFDFPEVDELPPYAREGYDAVAQASLAPRILLCTGVTLEVLEARIGNLLSRHGHIPSSKHRACVSDLRDEVRKRIRGHAAGRWTYAELLEVLVRHGGSVAPTRAMDHYVRPRSFDEIKRRLDDAHAVVISGPSGTGKTLTADILELDLRRADPPFDIVGEENGPGYVRHYLTRSDPILFHLRDPWGGNRLTPGADRWSGELPKLLDSAGPGRKFLITSRSDVLRSAGPELVKDLQPYLVTIEIEDYGPERLAKIYDGIAGDLSGHAQTLARRYRDRALKALTRPYEVNRFLVALSREDARSPRKVDEIIADSQIGAISRVIAEQITPWGDDGATSAAIIWALLSARGAVAREVFPKLVRRLRSVDPSLRPDVEGLLDFLVAGRNIRQDGAALAFYHPRVEDGLRMTFMRRARDAESVLSTVVDVLAGWDAAAGGDWGVETGLAILRVVAKLEGIELTLTPRTQACIDAHLEAVVSGAGQHFDFERALQDLARYGSAEHLPSRLARVLIEGEPATERIVFLDRWYPPTLSAEDIAALREDTRTKPLIERFIREVLPFTQRDFDPGLVSLLGDLAPDLHSAFWDALDIIAGPSGPNGNIKSIVAGALAGEAPDYERAIARFARSEAEADTWMQNFAHDIYEAEEHAVDADIADQAIDEPSEQYHNAREGMKAVVQLRRVREGVAWMAQHPTRRLLAYALSNLIGHSHRTPDVAELRLLLEASDAWTRGHAWWAVQQHWNPELSDILEDELARPDLEDAGTRRLLIEIAALNSGTSADPTPQLIAVAARVPPERRFELVHDVMSAKLDSDPNGDLGRAARRARAEQLASTFTEAECEVARALLAVLAGDEIAGAASALSPSGRTLLGSILTTVSTDVAGPLVCLAAATGLEVAAIVQRLLATGDANDGEAAVLAVLIKDDASVPAMLRGALTHKRYSVRRKALRALVANADPGDRTELLVAAEDHSADVRLAWANLMKEHRWPEAIDTLIKLLEDQRNFSSHFASSPNSSWSKFSVARAAANALGAYGELPTRAVDALLRAAETTSADPLVECAALSALSEQEDERIVTTLIAALGSPGLQGASEYRPRAQAAAWGLLDRVANQRLHSLGPVVAKTAEQDYLAVAGPVLIAFGVLGGSERDGLLDNLRTLGSLDREELVRTAAVAAGNVAGLSLQAREQTLMRLASGVTLDQLSPEERADIEAWSLALDQRAGVQRFIAWLADVAFHLPTNGEVGDPREIDFPERIGVLTMRALSPAREENE
ncbi:hypothetical protein [Microvirga makkahensis]|uniref:Novel STAND NTPase 3 domain-containing protein n=1 Tax=Microvirga makkahensis TaxID=1128670 RepID=A0A7X3MQ93_9HYPH|nr:hypothetical protein [Microvirga makkahensis]MXQ11182.1 hypothetical protein [Microvirga makkahensis]